MIALTFRYSAHMTCASSCSSSSSSSCAHCSSANSTVGGKKGCLSTASSSSLASASLIGCCCCCTSCCCTYCTCACCSMCFRCYECVIVCVWYVACTRWVCVDVCGVIESADPRHITWLGSYWCVCVYARVSKESCILLKVPCISNQKSTILYQRALFMHATAHVHANVDKCDGVDTCKTLWYDIKHTGLFDNIFVYVIYMYIFIFRFL